MKIRPVGAELFSADGQTDKKKVIVVFRNFANAPKNVAISFQFRFFCISLWNGVRTPPIGYVVHVFEE
jgi:hypothetical protein